MGRVRNPREKLCASAWLRASKTRKKGSKSGRLRKALRAQVFRVLKRWSALAHSFFPTFSHAGHYFFPTAKITKTYFSSPTPNRLCSTSFVKTNAPGGPTPKRLYVTSSVQLMLPGGSCRPGLPLRAVFRKNKKT